MVEPKLQIERKVDELEERIERLEAIVDPPKDEDQLDDGGMEGTGGRG